MSETTRHERAEAAIKRASQGGFRGDARPATTFGQERMVAGMLAVAHSQMAVADELRQIRELLQRGGDTPIAVQAYTS